MRADSRKILRDAELKVTPLRLKLLDILASAPKPVGAPDLFATLKADGANYVTVYRTVKTLEEAGIIRRVNLRHNHADYELAGDGDHHHLICVSCGKIEEFDGCGVDELAKQVLKASKGFASIADHALEFFGTCRACSKK